MSKARAAEVRDLINGALKKDVLTFGSDKQFRTQLLPTGVLPIDILLQGGIARGRMTGISGTYSSLKTLIGLRTIATSQNSGLLCGFIDVEKTYDEEWAQRCGVDTKALLMPPGLDSGEEAFDVLEAMIRSGVDIVCIDSVAALLPESERVKALSGEKIQPGRLAALMSTGLRKVTAANKRHTAILWLNQTRMQIGIQFGNPEHPAGGRALPFYLSQHIVMRKTGKVTEPTRYWDGEKWQPTKLQIAQRFSAELEKSKLNMPQRAVHFAWDFRSSEIDLPGFLIGQGLEHSIITQRGNTWVFGGIKTVGRPKFTERLATDHDAMRALENEVRQVHQMPLSSYRGSEPRPKSRDAKPRAAKRSGTARASTQGAAVAGSDTTRRAKTSSTSSRGRTAASRSSRRTS